MILPITPIGTIRTPFQTKSTCPVQGSAQPQERGQLILLPEYQAGLHTITQFSHLIILYHFNQLSGVHLQLKPFLDDQVHGIFSTRHPCRPNGIGLSIVKLEDLVENVINVSEIDVLDNTPLIDIKPYVPLFDHRPEAGNGWVKAFRKKPLNRE